MTTYKQKLIKINKKSLIDFFIYYRFFYLFVSKLFNFF